MSTFSNNQNNYEINDGHEKSYKNLNTPNNSSFDNYSSQSTLKIQSNNNYYHHNSQFFNNHIRNHNISYTNSSYNMNKRNKKSGETKTILNVEASEFIPQFQSSQKQHQHVKTNNNYYTKNTRNQNDVFDHYNKDKDKSHYDSTSFSNQSDKYFHNNYYYQNGHNSDRKKQNYDFHGHKFHQNNDYYDNECYYNNYDDDDNIDNDYFCGPVYPDMNSHNESQHCEKYDYELGPIGLPFYVEDGHAEPSSLNKLSFENLNVDSKIWVCENNHWAFYKYQGVCDENVILIDTREKCQLFDLNDLPLMYLQPTESENQQEQISSKKSLINNIKHVKKELNHLEYQTGRKLRIDIPIVGLASCQIVTYDEKNSTATLQLADGGLFRLSLDSFEHEFEDIINNLKLNTSNDVNNHKINNINNINNINDDIKIKNDYNSKNCNNIILNNTITNRVRKEIEINENKWNYGGLQKVKERTLLWRTYRNTLMGCLAVGTRDLYPIDLKYEHLISISGLGLGFSYFDTEIDSGWTTQDIHLKLLLGDSQFATIFDNIQRFTHYKLTQINVNEIKLNYNENNQNKLLEITKIIVNNIHQSIPTICSDEHGHLGLIVAYQEKDCNNDHNNNNNNTDKIENKSDYYFLLKKYCELDEENEEITKAKHSIINNLLNCNILILIEPPISKDRKYSLTDAFDEPKTIYHILDNAIKMYETDDKYCDFVGKQALIKIIEQLELITTNENNSNSNSNSNSNNNYNYNYNYNYIDENEEDIFDCEFGCMMIYELIRFWDSRYYMKKFLEEYDVPRPNLHLTFINKNGMEQYTKSHLKIKECVKNELIEIEKWNLFQQYIVEYKGQSLFDEDNLNSFKKQ